MTTTRPIGPRSAAQIVVAWREQSGIPAAASLELTGQCNLRCRHCYQDNNANPGLPTPKITETIDELAAMGTLFLTFTGGEITVRPDWLDIVRHARRQGFAIRLMTNGALLTPEDVEELRQLAILAVHVSLYGSTSSTHDETTGVAGSFDRTYKTIRRLRRAGIRVTANIPVMAQTGHDLEGTIALARREDCDLAVDPRILGKVDRSRSNQSLCPDDELMNHTASVLRREGFSQPDAKPRGETPPAWPCLRKQATVHVRADGQVWMCPILPVSLGSVLEDSIRRIWTTSEARQALTHRADGPLPDCQHCAVAWACHRCPAHAWTEHGDLSRPATNNCTFARARAHAVSAQKILTCQPLTCGGSQESWARPTSHGEDRQLCSKGRN